ncbi:MAG: hypothetical protein P8Y94_17335 [Acidobacteriota bacterium]
MLQIRFAFHFNPGRLFLTEVAQFVAVPLGQTEIQDLDLTSRRQHDIGRLDIAMDDPDLMRRHQSFRALRDDLEQCRDIGAIQNGLA